MLLLCSLPQSFDPLVMTLLYGKETLHYKDIVSVLQPNEQREKLTQESVPQEGLAAGERSSRGQNRSKSRRRSKSRKDKKEVKCFKC